MRPLLLLLAGGALAAAPPAPDVAAYDVAWSSPSAARDGGPFEDGMPLGNGATVVLAWANTTAGGLSFYVRHPHAQHTDSTDFTLARVTVALVPNPFLGSSYFNQTHHLEDGSVTVLAGGSGFSAPAAVLRIFVDALSDTVVVTAAAGDGATPFALAVLVDSVRPAPGNYSQPFYCFRSSFRPDVAGPLDAGAPPGSVALRHENCVACGDPDLFAFSVQQQGLAPALPSPLPRSPLDGRVFGVGAFGGAGADGRGAPLARNAAGTALASAAPAPAFVLTLCVRVADEAPAQWEAGLAAQLVAAAAAAPAARAAASAAWWAAFWGRSWVALPGLPAGSNASQVAPQYARTRFIQAAQSRNVKVPIKFNGMLYTTAGGEKGPLDVDARDWGPDNWWQNTRLPYGAMLAAGDYDTLAVVLEWASAFLPLARARTQLLLPGVEGAFFTEIVNAFGLYQGKMYAGPECNRTAGYPPWLAEGGWVRWDFSGNALGPEAGMMAMDLFLHTGNLSQAQQYVPIATSALDFIATFYKNRSADGKMLIWPTQVLESWWCEWPGWSNCPENDMPTVAAATALAARLLALPPESGLVSPAQRAAYAALAAILPALPAANGTWQSADVLSTDGPEHREVPQLFPAHPFRLVTAGRAALDAASAPALATGQRTFNASQNAHKNIGWYYGGIDAALLGLAGEAWAMLVDRATNSPPQAGYRFPAFAPHLQDSEPSADHYANLMTALQAMLLQAGGDAADTLVLLPAWPCDVDVSFKLWGARNTTVNVVYAAGALVALDVQPPERAAAVRWARCVSN